MIDWLPPQCLHSPLSSQFIELASTLLLIQYILILSTYQTKQYHDEIFSHQFIHLTFSVLPAILIETQVFGG